MALRAAAKKDCHHEGSFWSSGTGRSISDDGNGDRYEKLACGDACLRSRELASGLRSVIEPTVCRFTTPSRYLLLSSSTRAVRFAGFRLNLSGQADSSPTLTGSKYDCRTRLGIREGLVVVQSQPKVSTDDGKTGWVDTPGVTGQLHRADMG